MTTYKSDAVTAGVMPDFAQAGVILCRSATYTPAAALAAASVIQMVPVPANCQILDIQAWWTGGTDATAGYIDIGDADDPDKYFDGKSVKANFFMSQANNASSAATGWFETYSTSDTIDVTVVTSALGTNGTLGMNVFYKMLGTIGDEG
jgi:hypothetical protein